jgi:hypothetical protein
VLKDFVVSLLPDVSPKGEEDTQLLFFSFLVPLLLIELVQCRGSPRACKDPKEGRLNCTAIISQTTSV